MIVELVLLALALLLWAVYRDSKPGNMPPGVWVVGAVGGVQGQQTWEHAPTWVGGGCFGQCTGTANLGTCPQVGGGCCGRCTGTVNLGTCPLLGECWKVLLAVGCVLWLIEVGDGGKYIVNNKLYKTSMWMTQIFFF